MTSHKSILLAALVVLLITPEFAYSQTEKQSPVQLLDDVQRVVFLGDSITYSGQFAAHVEFVLRKDTEKQIEFLNVGLPSETVSGLSERGHAGGRFPRPDVHERLARALEQTKPDLVIACYGMNCGIYRPYSEERFAAFQTGMTKLHDAVIESGAKILHVTPTVFDPEPKRDKLLPAGRDKYPKGYVGYDEVLDLYSAWLFAQRGNQWHVVDAHTPTKAFLTEKRDEDPEFRLSKDGVHIDDQGHYLVAREILRGLGQETATIESSDFQVFKSGLTHPEQRLLQLIKQRQKLCSDYWLNQIGHQRPGMKAALPEAEFLPKVQALDKQINAMHH